MKSFKEIMEESKRIDEEMESLMQSIGYESLEAAAKDAEEFLKLIGGVEMLKFNSDEFIKEMEELNKGVEETPLDYEEFESWYEEHQQETERGLRGGL